MGYKTPTGPMADTVMCDIDGVLVIDTELHDAWHKSINLIATDVYGGKTEID